MKGLVLLPLIIFVWMVGWTMVWIGEKLEHERT
jgi:hypothetical protein